MSVMQRLYDSEINCKISTFYDDGFKVQLGDDMNGIKATATMRTWADVEEWLDGMARVHFPLSVYARTRRR